MNQQKKIKKIITKEKTNSDTEMEGPLDEAVLSEDLMEQAIPAELQDINLDDRKDCINSKPGTSGTQAKTLRPTVQTAGKAKLSGAQRRKLAIAKAKANGEEIRPRKPRPIRKDRPQTDGAEPSVVQQGVKRIRSSGSTPQDKKLFKKPKHNTQSAPTTATNEAPIALKMAVVPGNFPEGRLTGKEYAEIQNAMLEEILKSSFEDAPQFESRYLDAGAMYVNCANENSKKWLLDVVPRLQPWKGAVLRVGTAREIVQTTKVVVWVPTSDSLKNPAKIFQMIKLQNGGIKTENWRIISSRPEKQGLNLVLGMEEASLKELSDRGFKAYLGLTHVTFKVIKAKKEEKHAASNPN